MVMERRRRGIATAVSRSTVAEILHRVIISRFDFNFAGCGCRCLLLSELQHVRVVGIDFTETRRYVVPVSALGQRRESLGQSHQESASAIVDGFLEKFVDLRGAFSAGFESRFHESHDFVAVRKAAGGRRRDVGDGRGRVDRHRSRLVLMVLLQWMLLLLRPVQLAEQIRIQIASLEK